MSDPLVGSVWAEEPGVRINIEDQNGAKVISIIHLGGKTERYTVAPWRWAHLMAKSGNKIVKVATVPLRDIPPDEPVRDTLLRVARAHGMDEHRPVTVQMDLGQLVLTQEVEGNGSSAL